MGKIIVKLVLAVIFSCGLNSYSFADSASRIQSCEIATNTIGVGGGTIPYITAGKGPHVVLLHGLFAEKEQWQSLMCLLSEAGYATIAPDLPGYGKSNGFTIVDYTLENQVKIIHELMNILRINKFDIAGNSMGGAIAALYTQLHSPQVRSIAFIGAPLGIIDWANSVKNAIYHGINPFIPINERQFDLELSLLFINPPQIPRDAKEEEIKSYITRNRHYQQVWDIVNLYDDVLLKSLFIKVPTLILWGKDDKIFNVIGADRLQSRIPDSMMLKLPNAGHLLHVENADEVALTYVKFLQSGRGDPPKKGAIKK
ncbi:MAG: alpha/beta hydrolase [Candidatus Dadabacteria bacterium]|nr:alpha/beta hydrolase [Candidatus Dadabacteria bacterium]